MSLRNLIFHTRFTLLSVGKIMTKLHVKPNCGLRKLTSFDLRLKRCLEIPDEVQFYKGSYCHGLEALCILLKRLAYPCRYCDMVPRFGRSVPDLCKITHLILNHIYVRKSHLLQRWDSPFLTQDSLQTYANVIHAKGAPLSNCFGFIDGTVRPICRPGKHQRDVYNGHKRVHSIKFQSIVIPNGLIANLSGPWEGRKHDAGMLAESGLMRDLERIAYSPTGETLCIYGDPAYPLRVYLQAPFRDANLTDEMKAYNKAMNSVRVSVEWLFGEIVKYFRCTDFKRGLQLRLSPIGKIYIVCAILQNAHACLYGNIVSEYFQLQPPTLEEYLQLQE
ncbi:uncharacterized protein LOC114538401 [Dendronephthya gigantea]|uniref:uncharacterized protein LOC114538401 n=1 Tax=Dendronephthya gigantea TaxID=151771 RepID=UPI00106A1110|nr:uncharacterized protein LOC114538401 [Dendronephthya gigantea]